MGAGEKCHVPGKPVPPQHRIRYLGIIEVPSQDADVLDPYVKSVSLPQNHVHERRMREIHHAETGQETLPETERGRTKDGLGDALERVDMVCLHVMSLLLPCREGADRVASRTPVTGFADNTLSAW